MVVHAVSTGQADGHLVSHLYDVADDRDLPEAARSGDGRMSWRMRARHRLPEPERPVDRAGDADIVALLGACRSARDRLIVLLMARAGLRRGELCGLRRSDVHLLNDSRPLGCEITRAHVHVVRREDNPNGAWAKSRRARMVPVDSLVVQATDDYVAERHRCRRALVGSRLEPEANPVTRSASRLIVSMHAPDMVFENHTAGERAEGPDDRRLPAVPRVEPVEHAGEVALGSPVGRIPHDRARDPQKSVSDNSCRDPSASIQPLQLPNCVKRV